MAFFVISYYNLSSMNIYYGTLFYKNYITGALFVSMLY